MPRKSPDFALEEIPGDQYADLAAAQQAAPQRKQWATVSPG
jgi:hypothetical protein